jgi:hypothetical protein
MWTSRLLLAKVAKREPVSAAVGEVIEEVFFLGLEDVDAGRKGGELPVNLVVVADVSVESPVLDHILDFQPKLLEDGRGPGDGSE